MSRFKLYIEYEGTRYSGWQKQKNAKTIQGTLLNIAQDIFNDSNIDLQGSGRTDSGVHALCQVAHLEVKTILAPEIIKFKMNDKLPSDINILQVEKSSKNFHARHNAVSRSYIYQISKRRTAFGKNFVWWIKDDLNFNEMMSAAQEFTGMHDFFSFAEKDNEEKSSKVLIDNVQLKNEGDLILIRIIGSHFLWKMVRRMVGVLVEIGRGKMTSADLKTFLITKTKEGAKYTAPPSGLFLENVYYKGDKIEDDFEPPVKFMSALYRQE
ncbi:MAG: tRNA pseudouridine(38-40) synthase TruA [Ignavibacteriaceae bacterium]